MAPHWVEAVFLSEGVKKCRRIHCVVHEVTANPAYAGSHQNLAVNAFVLRF